VECIDGERNFPIGTVGRYECADPLRTFVGPETTTCAGNVWTTDVALSSCVVTKCAESLPGIAMSGVLGSAVVGTATYASCVDANEAFDITADENDETRNGCYVYNKHNV
jgi:hypothetical protein